MKALFGITNNNIHTVVGYIQEFKQQLPEERKSLLVTQILSFGEEPKPNVKVLLVPSVQLLIKNLSLINRTNAVVFVFDAAVLCDYLKPIQLLDVHQKNSSFSYTFKPIDYDYIINNLRAGLNSKGSIKVEAQTVKVIPTMLDQIKGRSLMQPILNFLYRIPDTDMRHQYQSVIIKWLLSELPLIDLKNALSKSQQSDQLQALLTYLKSEPGVEGRRAVQEVLNLRRLKKPVNYTNLAKKYPNIDVFDVRYVLKIYKRMLAFRVENTELKEIFLQRKSVKKNED